MLPLSAAPSRIRRQTFPTEAKGQPLSRVSRLKPCGSSSQGQVAAHFP